jgi:hypothetical protein
MKKIIFLIILPVIQFFAQDLEIQNKWVEGILYLDNETYLILEEGYLQIPNSDPYEEYYRKIYNDSTIVNPNTEIINEINFNLIPFINQSGNSKSKYFNQHKELSHFFNFGSAGEIYLSPKALRIIDELNDSE